MVNPYGVYALILALAALNRNSSILFVLAYFALAWPYLRQRRVLAWGVAYTLEWTLITGGLMLIRPPAEYWNTAGDILRMNVVQIERAAFFQLPFIPLILLLVIQYRRAPPPLKRLAWIIPLYLMPIAALALWDETRLWLSIFPAALAVLLFNID